MDKQQKFSLGQNLTPNVEQTQKGLMSQKMHHALKILMLPVTSLEMTLLSEIEQNPLLDWYEEGEELEENEEETSQRDLDFEENDYSLLEEVKEDFAPLYEDDRILYQERAYEGRNAWWENTLASCESLSESLINQLHMQLEEEDFETAEIIIGCLDERGYLDISSEELVELTGESLRKIEEIVEQIKMLDPPGIGAKDMQEALLLQLKRRGETGSLAYRIVEEEFENLLKNNLKTISKQFNSSHEQLKEAIDQILHLNIYPRTTPGFYGTEITVDLIVDESSNGDLSVRVNDEQVPEVTLNREYLKLLHDEAMDLQERSFLEEKYSAAKWLIHSISLRNRTLFQLGVKLVEKQQRFFKDPFGRLIPMTMKDLAEELSLHESTVTRAIRGKYLQCGRGVFPLRSFFTSSLKTDKGVASSETARNLIQYLIEHEEKSKPLTDQEIVEELTKRGINCARRTVAKYRVSLQLGNAKQRRRW